jgi:hypothetical protein
MLCNEVDAAQQSCSLIFPRVCSFIYLKLSGNFLAFNRLTESDVKFGKYRACTPHMCLCQTTETILINVDHFIHDHRFDFHSNIAFLSVTFSDFLVLINLLE